MAIPWLITTLCTLAMAAVVPEDVHHRHTSSSNDTVDSLHPRAATILGNGGRTPWPLRRYQGHADSHTIEYCFATPLDYSELWCQVQNGLRVWADALGGAASAATGHSLGFKELLDANRQPIPCYLPGTWDPVARSGTLDPRVADDVLTIAAARYGRPNEATVGYNTRGGIMRHYLYLKPDLGAGGTRAAAHEIGHVLGMVHEHQRGTRDEFVSFACVNVNGFQDCVNRAVAAGNPIIDAQRRLCEDIAFASAYNCPTSQFIKGQMVDNTPILPVTDSPPDTASIMMYGSLDFANIAECSADKFKCPLLQWRMNQWVLIPFNTVPSAYDVAWVRKYYPWVGPAMVVGGSSGNMTAKARRTAIKQEKTTRTTVYENHGLDGTWNALFRVREGGPTA